MRGAYQHCLGWRSRLSENVNSVRDGTSAGFRVPGTDRPGEREPLQSMTTCGGAGSRRRRRRQRARSFDAHGSPNDGRAQQFKTPWRDYVHSYNFPHLGEEPARETDQGQRQRQRQRQRRRLQRAQRDSLRSGAKRARIPGAVDLAQSRRVSLPVASSAAGPRKVDRRRPRRTRIESRVGRAHRRRNWRSLI